MDLELDAAWVRHLDFTFRLNFRRLSWFGLAMRPCTSFRVISSSDRA